MEMDSHSVNKEIKMKGSRTMSFIKTIMMGLLFSIASANAADWVVDNQHSQLNFISIKKGNVAEVHQFNQLQGKLDSQGQFVLDIDLTSVDTHNAVRDERMTKHLFNVEQFATAQLKANIALSELDAIAQGASKRLEIEAKLNLHGEEKTIKLNVMVTRLVGAKLSVVSTQPVILTVGDYALVSGVDKLMELAKLPSISHAVPVSFYLTFNLKQ